ncbi:lytic transglycosylase domain-containing protein [Phenylobacterium sp.]|uniref:lytic transglycosylase domain-containing protein n=1 Tax=Phenylobacterium sp. TaxID=1871053 RepID=UPI0025D95D9D|nr:lytic transglycosylase domain-containing protein [Phenylobacterium sp.]
MPSRADVIEFGAGGAAVTYAAPAVFTSTGVETIGQAPRAPGVQSDNLSQVIADAAVRNRISSDLVSAVAWQESHFRQSAVSSRGAVGVMQLTAVAARDVGVDRFDTSQNIQGGAAYLRRMMDRYSGDLHLTLAAYNAGPGAVDRYRGVPPFQETQAYVSAILARLPQRAAIPATPILFNR